MNLNFVPEETGLLDHCPPIRYNSSSRRRTMARPLRIEFAGAFYHVTSRGDEKRDIYKSSRDRERFLEYLASAMERYGAVIHAYCLMTSHYHLLIETPLGNLSQIMQHINGAYTTYFNVKRKRAGHLFQGRYRCRGQDFFNNMLGRMAYQF